MLHEKNCCQSSQFDHWSEQLAIAALILRKASFINHVDQFSSFLQSNYARNNKA